MSFDGLEVLGSRDGSWLTYLRVISNGTRTLTMCLFQCVFTDITVYRSLSQVRPGRWIFVSRVQRVKINTSPNAPV